MELLEKANREKKEHKRIHRLGLYGHRDATNGRTYPYKKDKGNAGDSCTCL
jgi:hypothetical protein